MLVLGASLAASAGAEKLFKLAECIDLGIKRNLDVQIAACQNEVTRSLLQSSQGAYNPQLRVGFLSELENIPDDFSPRKDGSQAAYEWQSRGVDAGLGGLLPTGTRYDLTASTRRVDGITWFPFLTTFPGNVRNSSYYTSVAALTLRQPLLRNFAIDPIRRAIQVNRKTLQMSETALQQQIMRSVAEVERSFVELLYLHERLRIAEESTERARTLAKLARSRLDAGKATINDVEMAEAQAATTEAEVFLFQQRAVTNSESFKLLLTDDLSSMAGIRIKPVNSIPEEALPPDRDASWQRALRLRPDLQHSYLREQRQDIEVRYRRNQTYPDLELSGGLGSRTVADKLGQSLADHARHNEPTFGFGVSLSLTLDNRAAKNRYHESLELSEQARRQSKRLEQQILAQISEDAARVQREWHHMETVRQARQYAERALKMEQFKYENGASTMFFLIQAERDLAAAQAAVARSRREYRESQSRLAYHEGSILERHSLKIDLK